MEVTLVKHLLLVMSCSDQFPKQNIDIQTYLSSVYMLSISKQTEVKSVWTQRKSDHDKWLLH